MMLVAAQQSVKRLLDDRGVAGEDVVVDIDIPGFIWAIARGEYYVIFVEDISKATAQSVFDFCTEAKVKRCIVAFRGKCTPTASKELNAFKACRFEKFKIEEIARVPLIFSACNTYKILTGPEAEEVFQKYGKGNLAKIWTTDIVQRYFDAPVGAVYKTIETFGTLQPEVKYRLVCCQHQ
jgi:DNA-directed RNA polymerase subunit H (RpoH/RPB5)